MEKKENRFDTFVFRIEVMCSLGGDALGDHVSYRFYLKKNRYFADGPASPNGMVWVGDEIVYRGSCESVEDGIKKAIKWTKSKKGKSVVAEYEKFEKYRPAWNNRGE